MTIPGDQPQSKELDVELDSTWEDDLPKPDEEPQDEELRAAERNRRVMKHDFSRNRHFDWYQAQEQGVRSFRRIVQGLIADLEHADPDAQITVEHDPGTGRFRLSLSMKRYRATHTCYLDETELEALRTHPELGHRLNFTGSAF